jgi:hypothetical protein
MGISLAITGKVSLEPGIVDAARKGDIKLEIPCRWIASSL